MKLVYWNEKFEVGIPEIDEQHQTLIELINQLSSSISRKDSISVINDISNKLIQYMALHFRDEEEIIMLCVAMPESEKSYHYEQHAMFNQHINALIDNVDLTDLLFAKDLLDYLTTWLISHILGSDVRLASYVKRDEGVLDEFDAEESLTISHVERVLLAALNESERRFRLFSDHAATLIWIANAQGERTFFNQAWQNFVHDEKSLIKNAWQQYVHPNDLENYLNYLDGILQNKHSGEIEYRLRTSNGEYRYFYERILPRFEMDHSLIGHMGSAIDITHLKEAESILSKNNSELEQQVKLRTREIQELMKTDVLTEVSNREHVLSQMEIELKRAKRHGRPLSLMYLDIDDFRQVKEKLGYEAADHILKTIAQSINDRVRESDVFGRYNAEQFLAVLPETTVSEAALLGELVRKYIKQNNFDGLVKPITLSIGVAELNRNESLEEWFSRCKRALEKAGIRGSDQVSQPD